jgi:hypothetical protein
LQALKYLSLPKATMTTNNIFYLDLPDGWKETTVYTFEGPDDSGLKHNLVLAIDPKTSGKIDLKSYVQAQIHNSLSNLPGFDMVTEKEVETTNGASAYLICYKFVPAPEKILFQKQFYIVDENTVCVFTSSYTKKTLQTIAYEIDEIIKSFRLLNGKEIGELIGENSLIVSF